jgi:hypothetical protein
MKIRSCFILFYIMVKVRNLDTNLGATLTILYLYMWIFFYKIQ